MPIRAYLSEWKLYEAPHTEPQDPADPATYSWIAPAIDPVLIARGRNSMNIDLRTAEQQGQIPPQGWALVLTDVRPPDHNQIMAVPNTHEVNASTTVAEVRAIIGDEATDDALDGSNIEQLVAYFRATHTGRVNRWKGRL